MKVLMVCLGNICRSPLAEGILRTKAQEKGLEIKVDSCGTANYHQGEAPDSRSIQVAKENGIDISQLQGRQFTVSDFQKFDHILAMDEKNLSDLIKLAPNEESRKKLELILNYHPNLQSSNVKDPYYGNIQDFENVYQQLSDACEGFINTVLKSK